MSRRVRRGFTLLEALVALVIVGTVVTAAMAALGGSLRVASQVEGHATAVALADARLSELSLLPTDSLAYYAQPREGRYAAPLARYAWRARLEQKQASTRALLHATVTVSWASGEYTLATDFFRPDRLLDAQWRFR